MKWIQLAHAELSSNVIRRCWSKANILPASLQAALENTVDRGASKDQATTDLIDLLKSMHIDKQRAVIEDLVCDSAEEDDSGSHAAGIVDAIVDFVNDELVSEVDISCVEVLASIQVSNAGVEVSDTDNDADVVLSPSVEEAKDSCLLLLAYFEARGVNAYARLALESMLHDIETQRLESLKQSKLHFV